MDSGRGSSSEHTKSLLDGAEVIEFMCQSTGGYGHGDRIRCAL